MSNRTNGSVVRSLEAQFARYVGARYGIACCNGTATLHTALHALGVQPGDCVAVPPLTMASTTLAVLHAGAVPRYVDVDARQWTMMPTTPHDRAASMPVSLYGLEAGEWYDYATLVVDAAETLQQHHYASFTSYSFQASKILSAGEGGMLVTNDSELAAKSYQFRDLGYAPDARGSMKHPDAIRHVALGYNYRMSDAQAQLVLDQLPLADDLLARRRYAAQCYRDVIQGCEWLTPQYVPDGWPHSYWTYAVAIKQSMWWEPFVLFMEQEGCERPYAAWRLTYQEPAFRHLAKDGTCPVAEDLQPRLIQLQTNHATAAESEYAAECLKRAIWRFAKTLPMLRRDLDRSQNRDENREVSEGRGLAPARESPR